jgi:hypothetical protein
MPRTKTMFRHLKTNYTLIRFLAFLGELP